MKVKECLNINFSPELRRLLKHCEVRCTADCCKSNAFDIDPNTIRKWQEMEPPDRVEDRIENISIELKKLKDEAYDEYQEVHIIARGLESSWSPAEIKGFFKELNDNFFLIIINFEGGEHAGSPFK